MKDTLYELLKITPSIKDTVAAIISQIPKEKLKLFEIQVKDKEYNLKKYMSSYYSYAYSKYSLKNTKILSLPIVENNERLRVNKKFSIGELKTFTEKFQDLFTSQKPPSIWGKIFVVIGSSISGIISLWIGRLFFKKS